MSQCKALYTNIKGINKLKNEETDCRKIEEDKLTHKKNIPKQQRAVRKGPLTHTMHR